MDAADLLEQRIPDVVSTVGLPVRLAAEIDFLAGRVDRWCRPLAGVSPAVVARSLAASGRQAESRAALSLLDLDTEPVADVAVAAWAAARVGGPTVPLALARLEAEASDFLENELPLGPRRMYTGMLPRRRAT